MIKKLFSLGLLLLFPFLLIAQVEFEKEVFKNGNNELTYRLLKHKNFESDQ